MARLKEQYKAEVAPALYKKFGYKSTMQIPKIDKEGVAEIDVWDCKACGICVAECPAQAIELNQSEDERLIAACGTK